MATSNFLQWNPDKNNQHSDGDWLTNTQRLDGAANPSIFTSLAANKLFYQLTTMITALAESIKDKGITISDADISDLTSIMSYIQTEDEIRFISYI